MKNAVEILRKWNGQMDKDESAPVIASLLYQEVRKAVGTSASHAGDNWSIQMSPAIVETVLRSGGTGWFKDTDAVLARSLERAIDAGVDLQGGNLARWRYGKYNELTIKNPIGSQIPVVGKYFNIGPVWMSGSSTTVKQTTKSLGPSMRFVADLSDWDKSLNNITTGESGQFLSRHYKDQWDAYYVARSYPMQFAHVDAKDTLVFRPE